MGSIIPLQVKSMATVQNKNKVGLNNGLKVDRHVDQPQHIILISSQPYSYSELLPLI
jgi:hypothetical protein